MASPSGSLALGQLTVTGTVEPATVRPLPGSETVGAETLGPWLPTGSRE